MYEDAKKDFTECDDVLLWNGRYELTESCIANIVLEIDGNLLTPPVHCGLLAGTFRSKLLEAGTIREQVLKVRDLKRCSQIYLINSVRRWQKAVLIGTVPGP